MNTQNVTPINPTPLSKDFTVDSATGEAFISQRKAAELCGVERNSVVHFFKDKGDISQGVSSEQLPILVQHYAERGRPEAVKTLCLFAQAGAKAFIYDQAGFKMKAEPKPMTQTEIALMTLQKAVESEHKIKMLEQEVADLKDRQDKMDGDTGYMTALAYCREHGMPAPLKTANALGRRATKICKRDEWPIGRVPDERWGHVNSYPVEVLDDAALEIIS